jgi:NAD(P)-dependent dehydrogenase (short-subunit alcohol dehydrogenase family)
VVLACRDLQKGERARREMETAVPGTQIELEELDLASLDSVRAFAERFRGAHERLDLLINNAGVTATPRRRTADGFELQFGTNHLGHFALTGLLIGAMEGRDDARVITLSSSAAYRMGRIAFDNLGGERRYFRWRAYVQSKLANLLFMLEIDRRLRAAGSTTKSLGAHPGYADTNLQFAGPPLMDRLVMHVLNRVVAQSAEMGALSPLYAATQLGLEGDTYIGPDGFLEQRGHPKRVSPSRGAQDENVARQLWEVSEQMTGVRFDLAGAPRPSFPSTSRPPARARSRSPASYHCGGLSRAHRRPELRPCQSIERRDLGCEASLNSCSSAVTKNTACSAMSTALSPIRSRLRAISTYLSASSRSRASPSRSWVASNT